MLTSCRHCGMPLLVAQPSVRYGFAEASGRGRTWVLMDGSRIAHRCSLEPPGHAVPPIQSASFAAELTLLLDDLESVHRVDDVARLVAQRVAPLLDAVYSNMALIDGTSSMRIAHHDFLAPELATKYDVVPLDHSTPLGTAILSGAPVLLPSLAGYKPLYAHMIEDTRRAGISATVSFPICDPNPSAAIGVAWEEWDESQASSTLGALENIARSCALALKAAAVTHS